MTYIPKHIEDFVKTPVGHLLDRHEIRILTSVIISTIQKPGKMESTPYAFDLNVFSMPQDMQKWCFVLTFDENSNVVAGSWFSEHEITKISPISQDSNEKFVFDKCLERYEAFMEKLKIESDSEI
jgi:hypothetical protein